VIVMHGRTRVQPDEIVRLQIDAAASHLFDSASGQRIDGVTLQ